MKNAITTRLSTLVFLFFLVARTSAQGNFPPGFAAVQVATGLDPVSMALAPDGRVFIAEKFGRVTIVKDGEVQPTPFLEVEVDIGNERGLCGVALDPDFETNHFVYIYYTVKDANHNRVSRFVADGDFAVPNSETILLDLDQLTGQWHNAGVMVFGNDGKLYIATGDGTGQNNAQDLTNTLGKILRINPDGSIPADNPFFEETTGSNRAIWSFGHRNPFGLTVQRSTGQIFSAEVGAQSWEEVNEILPGKNYGWPIVEGPLNGQAPPANYQAPLHTYSHDDGCAAVGVAVYDPVEVMFPAEYLDKVFFSEYCFGEIRMLDKTTGEVTVFADEIELPMGMIVADDGTLYLIDRGDDENYITSTGSLWRVFYTGSDAPFITVPPRPTLVPLGEDAHFSVVVSGQEPFEFQWKMDGADILDAHEDLLTIPAPMLSDSGSLVQCVVSNALGSVTSEEVLLHVTSSQRPVPEIIQPATGQTYRAGETLSLLGEATDAEDGTLPASAFRWRVDFHHNDHLHPAFGPLTGEKSASFSIPPIGETSHNVWYKVHLTVTDASGLSASVEQDVFPLKSEILLRSQPSGFPVTINEKRAFAPDTTNSVVGMTHQISAAKSFIYNDSLYLFQHWDNGETAPQIELVPPDEGIELTAIYAAVMHKGDGTGLTGQYHDFVWPNRDFSLPAAFERIDSTINFDWTGTSPDLDLLGPDDYAVRWEGAVMPFFDEVINFHFQIEDGIRFWLDDELLIDKWQLNHNELQLSLPLEGGKKYPVRLEYYQGNWLSSCKMLWSSDLIERGFVPPSRLFPEYVKDSTLIENLSVKLRPNPVGNLLRLLVESPGTQELDWRLYSLNGQLLRSEKTLILPGLTTLEISVKDYPTGEYLLLLESGGFSEMKKFVKL